MSLRNARLKRPERYYSLTLLLYKSITVIYFLVFSQDKFNRLIVKIFQNACKRPIDLVKRVKLRSRTFFSIYMGKFRFKEFLSFLRSNIPCDTVKFIFVRTINFWFYHIHIDHIVTLRPISFRFRKLNDLENIKCELRWHHSSCLFYTSASSADPSENTI